MYSQNWLSVSISDGRQARSRAGSERRNTVSCGAAWYWPGYSVGASLMGLVGRGVDASLVGDRDRGSVGDWDQRRWVQAKACRSAPVLVAVSNRPARAGLESRRRQSLLRVHRVLEIQRSLRTHHMLCLSPRLENVLANKLATAATAIANNDVINNMSRVNCIQAQSCAWRFSWRSST